MRYTVVIEPTGTGFSAYVPDLPGCVATGASRAEIEREIVEAIRFHIEGLVEDGDAVPLPAARAIVVEAA